MRKFKYLFVTACAVFLCVMAFQAKEQVLPHQLNAATASGFQPPQLNLYDKVTIENQAMTVIDTNGSYKFLADDFNQTLVSGHNLTAIPDDRLLTMYGAFGKDVFSSYTKLPSYADLSNIKETVTENNTTKETLNSTIPAGDVGWWLSDSDDNSRSGVTKDNEVKAKGSYKNTETQETGCVESDVQTKGFLTKTITIPAKSKDFGELFASFSYKITVNSFNAKGANKFVNYAPVSFKGLDCKANSLYDQANGQYYSNGYIYNFSTVGTPKKTITVDTTKLCAKDGEKSFFANLASNMKPVTIKTNGKNTSYVARASIGDSTSPRVNFMIGNGIAEATLEPITEIRGGTVTCPARNYYAATNAIRPLLQLNSDSIVLGTKTPRTMNVASTINDPIPASDGIENLTIQTSSLSVGLDTNSKLVDGNTFYVPIGSTTANVPLTMKAVSSGTTYISAIANSNYGVLADVSGEQSASVAIDLTSLTKSADGSYEVTLYEENIGDNTTSYISSGTSIKIIEAEEQSIKFDENQTVSVEMGEDLDLNALYDGDVTKQAATNIIFSYDQPSQGTITISNPSYDSTTGKASAVFNCDGYVGDVTVKINKAGNSGYMPAEEKPITISVGKRAVKISAVVPDGIFKLNDAMPTLTRKVEGLDASDARIASATPYLEKSDPSYANHPAENGILKNVGSWKILLNTTNTLDTDLYDVTFVDYATDNSLLFYVFEKDFVYYTITPNANSNGWNNTPVTISLSNEAKSLGYTLIEVINKNNEVIDSGATIEYKDDIASITPVIRIRKGDTTTDAKAVREIKIDLKNPTAEVVLNNAGDWAQKKTVTITANDALSGVASVSVSLNGATYTVTQDSVNHSQYTFEADQEGTYDIVVSDEAGNSYTTTQEVDKIDTSTVTLNAVPETLTEDQPKQKITLTFDAGLSGIDTFKVYYKGSNDTEYKFYKNLDTTITSPYDFDACMNGSFKFELINKAGASAQDTVEITHVNPPKPVTKIDAAWEDDASKAYTSNTWTNQNILLTLSNINPAINGDIIWQMSTDNGLTWSSLDGNTKLVSSDAILNETYLFKAKIGEVEEEENQSFTVKIDKTKPAMPVIEKHEDYTSDAWFENGFTVTSSVVAKENNSSIGQEIYVCDGTKADCKDTPALWKKTNNGSYAVSGNGKHELYFKTIDEAGNESEITAPAYINLNNTAPVVTIKLNENKLKDLLQTITLGFFFKDTVDIKFDVEYGFDSGGTLKYIVDKNADRTTPFPDESDPRWTVGTSDTLTPDGKAMIYVIATSKAGVITKESSQYNVYADKTPPVITIPDTSAWSKDTTLEVEITDATAGVDASTVQYKIDQGSYITGSLVNDKLSITGLADGIYDIRINASDHSGNRLAKDAKTTVHIDSTAPVIGAIQAEKTGWINEQTITFSASDAVSDLAGVPVVKNSKNKTYTIVENEDGTYSCTIDKNDTYTISVKDNAGNEATASYVEAYIDTEPPVISNIVIDHANDWKASKKVSFDVIDKISDLDYVVVSYVEAGVEKQVNVSGPVGDTFSFTANQDGEYTITAYDKAGNTATETVTVEQIDPDGLKIFNISDTSAWAKDQMIVRFEVQTGNTTLKADFPKVTLDGNALTVTKTNNVYSFIATQNGTYTITAENDAADSVSEELVITKIDTMKPVIKNISDNTTSSIWREPVDISFHVYDYNSADESSMGSGMKAGYPNVYIMLDGNRTPIQITQDANDSSLFTFTAEYNTTYIVEAMDVVGHDIVEEHIVVDHILGKDIVSDIVVLAENDGSPLASGTWAKGEILFTISGGLDATALEKYQVAITQNGVAPVEADWQDLNLAATHQHKVTGNVNGDSYWFRALPSTSKSSISDAFVVRLDNAKPENLTITLTPRNTNAVASFVNTLTFGQWLNKEQEVSFSATDNFTTESDLRFEYAEKVDGVMGAWKKDTGSLSYADTNIELYARAIDLAGNISKEELVSLSIDTLPPIITGVKNQKEYKQYYLPRYVSVEDAAIDAQHPGSGLKEATYTKDDGSVTPIVGETRIFGTGTYTIDAQDNAGNSVTLEFRIVDLPDIDTEIDGSDESREIIDQIIKELEEVKDKIDNTEKDNYDKWITDAEEKWEKLRIKVVEDEETTSKVEGQGDTSFDPKTELIVEEIPKEKVPVLPRNAIKTYDVYLKKGNSVVQANGTVKVYLPYDEKEAPIVYEIKEDGTITEVAAIQEDGYVTFITNTLEQYAISNTAQEETKPTPNPDPDPNPNPKPDDGKVCVAGPDGKLGTADDVCVDPGENNEKPDPKPDGSIDVPGGGTIVFPDGGEIPIEPGDTGTLNPDGSVEIKPSGDKYGPDGKPIKPDTCPNDGKDINIDTNKDGKPDLNIDTDGDCKADLNVDVNEDGIPDVNIDTTLDGKPDYNVDVDDDGKPDVNIGPVNDPWKPSVCKVVGKLEYCSDPYKKPYLNVDTDGDGRPDLNLDLDGDLEADINIDVDGDMIPDVNIDTTGDGKADINIDIDNDGEADENLLRLTKWIPDKEVDGKIKYDTMSNLVPDPELNKNPNDGGYLSGGGNGDGILNTATGGALTNAATGDVVKASFWWILVLINGAFTFYMWRKKKREAK